MRSWESKDIVDILIDHHDDLFRASEGLANRERSEGLEEIEGLPLGGEIVIEEQLDELAEKLDDKCIVIENYLEITFGIEWTGLEFRKPSISTT